MLASLLGRLCPLLTGLVWLSLLSQHLFVDRWAGRPRLRDTALARDANVPSTVHPRPELEFR